MQWLVNLKNVINCWHFGGGRKETPKHWPPGFRPLTYVQCNSYITIVLSNNKWQRHLLTKLAFYLHVATFVENSNTCEYMEWYLSEALQDVTDITNSIFHIKKLVVVSNWVCVHGCVSLCASVMLLIWIESDVTGLHIQIKQTFRWWLQMMCWHLEVCICLSMPVCVCMCGCVLERERVCVNKSCNDY